MKKFLIVSTGMIFFTNSVLSDFKWKLMLETKNGDKYYLDLSSIEKDKNRRFYIRVKRLWKN